MVLVLPPCPGRPRILIGIFLEDDVYGKFLWISTSQMGHMLATCPFSILSIWLWSWGDYQVIQYPSLLIFPGMGACPPWSRAVGKTSQVPKSPERRPCKQQRRWEGAMRHRFTSGDRMKTFVYISCYVWLYLFATLGFDAELIRVWFGTRVYAYCMLHTTSTNEALSF